MWNNVLLSKKIIEKLGNNGKTPYLCAHKEK